MLLCAEKYILLYIVVGTYYTIDVSYPNRPGYLAPYKGEWYHVPDRRSGPPPNGVQEHFNHLHLNIRNVI